MLPQFTEDSLAKQSLTCPNCNWTGPGDDAVVIDFYGVTKTKEVHCPNCDEKLAILVKDDDLPPGESATDLSFQTG